MEGGHGGDPCRSVLTTVLPQMIWKKNKNWYMLIILKNHFRIVKMTANCAELQEDLVIKWQIKFNTDKCEMMLMRIFPLHFYTASDSTLSWASPVRNRNLGFTFHGILCSVVVTHVNNCWEKRRVWRCVLFYGAPAPWTVKVYSLPTLVKTKRPGKASIGNN